MTQTVADRICIRLHEAVIFNLARCRGLAGIGDSRSAKLHDIVSPFQGKANCTPEPQRRHWFSPQAEFYPGAQASCSSPPLR
ncbi:MAG: hypothetical protein J6333_04790 [Planctomycetes bacterium]|nr:hypothetical protein [Planctomycetota bacterium]